MQIFSVDTIKLCMHENFYAFGAMFSVENMIEIELQQAFISIDVIYEQYWPTETRLPILQVLHC